MLTKEYLKDNFIDAYFIDEERENIEILTTSEDKKGVIPTIVPFNEEHEGFKVLLSKMSVDDLHERTYIKKKEERKLFEEQLIRISKKDGFIPQEGKIDNAFFNGSANENSLNLYFSTRYFAAVDLPVPRSPVSIIIIFDSLFVSCDILSIISIIIHTSNF